MPDIDMDFDDERRGEVIDYVSEKYGADKVAQIITFGTMKARAAVRDAGRVLGYPYGVPDKISKMIVDDLERDDRLARSTRTPSSRPTTRPTPTPSASSTPPARSKASCAARACTRPASSSAETRCTTTCRSSTTPRAAPSSRSTTAPPSPTWACSRWTSSACARSPSSPTRVQERRAQPRRRPRPRRLPARRRRRRSRCCSAPTPSACSRSSRPACASCSRTSSPTTFGDIVAVLALYRPGPLGSGMVKDFVERKHGQARGHLLRRPPQADPRGDVRRDRLPGTGHAHLDGDVRASRRPRPTSCARRWARSSSTCSTALETDWVEGAASNGYDPKLAESMWADIVKFAEYAFNKSHSAAYGLITMQTAYLKAHYPLEYMAAVLTSYTGKTDKIVHYVAECNRAGYTVLPPDVNTSGADFTPVTGEGIRFGLAGIRGVGEGVVEAIIAARDEGGAFTSLHDFCARVDMQADQQEDARGAHQGRRVRLDRLHAQAPALDDGPLRRLRAQAPEGRRHGQVSMFDMFAAEDSRLLRGGPAAQRRRVGQEDEARVREGDARHLRLGPPAARDRRAGPARRRLLARRHRRAQGRDDRLVRRDPRQRGRASPPRRAR